MIFVFLSFLTALVSFLHELNLAQALSGVLGGTIVRYQVTFGLFTFSLGLGALLYEKIRSEKKNPRRILLFSQFAVLVAGALGPFWIKICDPLSWSASFDLFFQILAHLPIFAVGLFSGLELPALMDLSSSRSEQSRWKVLASDYTGMVVASLIFPVWLLSGIGVQGTALLATALTFLSLLVTFRLASSTSPSDQLLHEKTTDLPSSPQLTPPVAFALIGIVSFCSLVYELVLCRVVTDFTQDEPISHSLTLAAFLVGMALGTWKSPKLKNPLSTLIRVEVLLTLLGLLSLTIMLILVSARELSPFWFDPTLTAKDLLPLLLPLPLVLGLLTGFELPLLLRLSPKTSTSLGLAVSYCGALLAGLLVPLFLVPNFGSHGSLILAASLNLFVCLFLVTHLQAGRPLAFAICLTLGLLIPPAARLHHDLEKAHLKIHYLQLRLNELNLSSLQNLEKTLKKSEDIKRWVTPYQFIDILDESVTGPVLGTSEFTMFLNRQTQFTRSTWLTYHESMIAAGKNLNRGRSPFRRILILGGGDGLLAHVLLRDPQVESITLVEIDPRMIALAKEWPDLVKMNQSALQDPKVQVIQGDAFEFIRRHDGVFDAVYIDFPYPESFELSRLYSLEFYQSLRRVLAAGAFFVLDAPLQFQHGSRAETRPTPFEILASTIQAAGYPTLQAFGLIEPFIFVSPDPAPVAFDYAQIPPSLSNRSFVNLTPLDFLLTEMEIKRDSVNRIDRPLRF